MSPFDSFGLKTIAVFPINSSRHWFCIISVKSKDKSTCACQGMLFSLPCDSCNFTSTTQTILILWKDVCVTVSPLWVQNWQNMKLHALRVHLHMSFSLLLCFFFCDHVFAQDMCPEVCALKASDLSFSSYLVIKNEMPSGHHVTHLISVKSAYVMLSSNTAAKNCSVWYNLYSNSVGACLNSTMKVYFVWILFVCFCTFNSFISRCSCPRPESSTVDVRT